MAAITHFRRARVARRLKFTRAGFRSMRSELADCRGKGLRRQESLSSPPPRPRARADDSAPPMLTAQPMAMKHDLSRDMMVTSSHYAACHAAAQRRNYAGERARLSPSNGFHELLPRVDFNASHSLPPHTYYRSACGGME